MEAASRGKKGTVSKRAIWDKRKIRKDRGGKLPCINGQKSAGEYVNSENCKLQRRSRLLQTKKKLMPCDQFSANLNSKGSVLPGINMSSSVSGVHLSEDVLDARRQELLARVKLDCDSERRKIERKQQMVARLKARQKAWIGENLMLDKRLDSHKIHILTKYLKL